MKIKEDESSKPIPSLVSDNSGLHRQLPEVLLTNPGKTKIKATARPSRPTTVVRPRRDCDPINDHPEKASSPSSYLRISPPFRRTNTESSVALSDFSNVTQVKDDPVQFGKGNKGQKGLVKSARYVKKCVDVDGASRGDSKCDNVSAAKRAERCKLIDKYIPVSLTQETIRNGTGFYDGPPSKTAAHVRPCYERNMTSSITDGKVEVDDRGQSEDLVGRLQLHIEENTNMLLDLIQKETQISNEGQAMRVNVAKVSSAINVLKEFSNKFMSEYSCKLTRESMKSVDNNEHRDNNIQNEKEEDGSKQSCKNSKVVAVDTVPGQIDKHKRKCSFSCALNHSVQGSDHNCGISCGQARDSHRVHTLSHVDSKKTTGEHPKTPIIVPGSIKGNTVFPPPSFEDAITSRSVNDDTSKLRNLTSGVSSKERCSIVSTKIKPKETIRNHIKEADYRNKALKRRDVNQSVVSETFGIPLSQANTVPCVAEKVLENSVSGQEGIQKGVSDCGEESSSPQSVRPVSQAVDLKHDSGKTEYIDQDEASASKCKLTNRSERNGAKFRDRTNNSEISVTSSPSPELPDDKCKRKRALTREKKAYFKSIKERIKKDRSLETESRNTSYNKERKHSQSLLPNRSSWLKIGSDERKCSKSCYNHGTSFLRNEDEHFTKKPSSTNGASKYRPEYIETVRKHRAALRRKLGLGNLQTSFNRNSSDDMGKPADQRDLVSCIYYQRSCDAKKGHSLQGQPSSKPLQKHKGARKHFDEANLRKRDKTQCEDVKEAAADTHNQPYVTMEQDFGNANAKEDAKSKTGLKKTDLATKTEDNQLQQSNYSLQESVKVDEWVKPSHSLSPINYWLNQSEKMKVSSRIASNDPMKFKKYATINRSNSEEENSPSSSKLKDVSTDEKFRPDVTDIKQGIKKEGLFSTSNLAKSLKTTLKDDKLGHREPVTSTDKLKLNEPKRGRKKPSGKQSTKRDNESQFLGDKQRQKGRQTRASLSARIWDELLSKSMTSTRKDSHSRSHGKESSHELRSLLKSVHYNAEYIDGANELASQTWQSALAVVDQLPIDTTVAKSNDHSTPKRRHRQKTKKAVGRSVRKECTERTESTTNSSLNAKSRNEQVKRDNVSHMNSVTERLTDRQSSRCEDEMTGVVDHGNKTQGEISPSTTKMIYHDKQNRSRRGRDKRSSPSPVKVSDDYDKNENKSCKKGSSLKASTVQRPASALENDENSKCHLGMQDPDHDTTNCFSGEDDLIIGSDVTTDKSSSDNSDWVSLDRAESPQDIFDFSCNLSGTSYYGRCASQSCDDVTEKVKNGEGINRSPNDLSNKLHIDSASFKNDFTLEKVISDSRNTLPKTITDDRACKASHSDDKISSASATEDIENCPRRTSERDVTCAENSESQRRFRVTTEEGETIWVQVEDMGFLCLK